MSPALRIAVLALAGLLAAGCGAAEDPRSAAAGEAAPGRERLEHNGVSIELPDGWEGRVLALDYPSAVLQAANFAFVPVGVELPPGEEDPIKAMTDEHVLLAVLPCGIVSFEEPPRPAPTRLTLDKLTFLPRGHPRVPRGHAFAHGSFEFTSRCLRIEVDFGAALPPLALKKMANEVLASLSVVES